MNGKPRFEVNYLPEAEAFVLELDEKTRRKVLYNITLASMTIDDELFKVHRKNAYLTVSSPQGLTLWLWKNWLFRKEWNNKTVCGIMCACDY